MAQGGLSLASYGQNKSLEAAEKLKELGNDSFHAKMFARAEEYYTKVCTTNLLMTGIFS